VLLAREDLHWLAMLLFLNLKMVGRVSSTHLSDGSIELFNKNGNRMVYVTTDVEGKGSMSAYDYSGNRIGGCLNKNSE